MNDVMNDWSVENLYQDRLVLMADSIVDLRVKFDKWKDALEGKQMKMKMNKTKLMVNCKGVKEL